MEKLQETVLVEYSYIDKSGVFLQIGKEVFRIHLSYPLHLCVLKQSIKYCTKRGEYFGVGENENQFNLDLI